MISITNSFIFILLFKGTTGRLCQHGWFYLRYTNFCYHLVTTPTTFNNAQFACILKKASLVSIHSEVENRFLSEMAAKAGSDLIWLGAAQFGNSKKYENIDLSPFDYTSWQNGTQPVYMKSRKCVKISSKNLKWFNDCCYYRPVPYICKKLTGNNGQQYWTTATGMTNNIKNDSSHYFKLSNSKFTTDKDNIAMKQQHRTKSKASDTVLPLVTKAYSYKNNDNKAIDTWRIMNA